MWKIVRRLIAPFTSRLCTKRSTLASVHPGALATPLKGSIDVAIPFISSTHDCLVQKPYKPDLRPRKVTRTHIAGNIIHGLRW